MDWNNSYKIIVIKHISIKKEMKPAPIPPKISLGQWTPQNTLKNPTRALAAKNSIANWVLNSSKQNEAAKKNEVWPEGKAGWFGFFINVVMGKTSIGLLRW